ncbi:hypothetical protein EJ08DRAFT_661127 [Tothia fuscella]|uniref:Uncharacterized protein n=1 Tax=Tothia fuscella TaxID=1048955 RepID=A0A9P4TYS2_9PEZI|nr:hypothetical protein EJ08DRAFT_661127 [Tothia fuscella]
MANVDITSTYPTRLYPLSTSKMFNTLQQIFFSTSHSSVRCSFSITNLPIPFLTEPADPHNKTANMNLRQHKAPLPGRFRDSLDSQDSYASPSNNKAGPPRDHHDSPSERSDLDSGIEMKIKRRPGRPKKATTIAKKKAGTGRPPGRPPTRKVHFAAQPLNNTVSNPAPQQVARVDPPVPQGPRPVYRRREDFRISQSSIDGQEVDKNGAPYHGIGEILEKRRKGEKFDVVQNSGREDNVLTPFLQKEQLQYQDNVFPKLLTERALKGLPNLPQDIPTNTLESPLDMYNQLHEMSASDEETTSYGEWQPGTREFLKLHAGLQWLIVEEIEDDFARSHVAEEHDVKHASKTLLGIKNNITLDKIIKNGESLRNTAAALPTKEECEKAAAWLKDAGLLRSLIGLYE